MLLYFVTALTIFGVQIGFTDALLLTSGALFTFGAKLELLDKLGLLHRILYVFSSFVGVSLTALFVTVLVNVFMRDR
jgi:hypothetical protein